MKKILTIKGIVIVVIIAFLFALIISVISVVTGVSFGYESANNQTAEVSGSSPVINNQLYTDRYKKLLNKFLVDKGYVSLERLVFYLQRTNNVLDVTTLSNEVWEDAYIKNLNEEYKQMVPIKTLCKEFKKDTTLPEYTITDGTNERGTSINALNLCVVDGVDITTSDDYTTIENKKSQFVLNDYYNTFNGSINSNSVKVWNFGDGNQRSDICLTNPICLEAPHNPVSTLCGHIFCEKCIRRMFKVRRA